jgi:ribose transport system ATP-binding protein
MGFSVAGLRKAYDGVPVLKGVDLAVEDGEIHALLGANGAGKSTLIKCLVGAVPADAGDILVDDEVVHFGKPIEAQRAGIRVVHQIPSLATTLNAGENVFLGREARIGPFLRRRHMRETARQWFSDLGMAISPRSSLSDLGNAELQMIEIVKALSAQPRVLILDEPTAALTGAEQQELMARLRDLRTRRLPILYVTHRLSEVFEVADRVTVLWGGRVALSARVADITERDLVEAIVSGPDATGSAPRVAPRASAEDRARWNDNVLEVRDLVAPKLGPVSLDAARGEILGIYGLVGSGRTELLEAIFGAEVRVHGTMAIDGERYSPANTAAAVAHGVALVPSDRLRKSMFPSLSALENAILPTMTDSAVGGVRRRSRERAAFGDLADRLRLQPRDPHLEARRFSGGNQQKLVISRWLGPRSAAPVRLLLLDEPTEGVDVGARQDLYRILREFADGGRAVVITSSEPEELVQLADRVIVLSGGRHAATLIGDALDVRTMTQLAHFNETEHAR